MTRRASEDLDVLLDEDFELDTTSDDSREGGEHTASNEIVKDAISTPRMWTLSLLFSIFGSSINLFFSLRYPSVSISPILAILLAHPLGLLWDTLFSSVETQTEYLHVSTSPDEVEAEEFDEHSPLHSPGPRRNQHSHRASTQKQSTWHAVKRWLGQGRWNEKEHCCVFIASNVSFGFAFATDVCW
jgi:hypothetical protein